MTVLLPFLIAVNLGYILVNGCFKNKFSLFSILLKLVLSIGLGIGIISIISFWGKEADLFKSEISLPKIVLRVLTVIGFLCIFFLITRDFVKLKYKFMNLFSKKWFLLFLIIFFFVFLLFIDRLWAKIALNPDGFWDAWSIWNLHARFLFFGGDYWRDLFSPVLGWSHPDYPLLTPAFIYFGWKLIGSNLQIIPILVSVVFTVALVLLILSSIALSRGFLLAVTGAVFLMVTLSISNEGAAQYADIPLAFFYLVVLIITIHRENNKTENYSIDFILGLFMGFCVFTKNEGWSFVVSILTIRILIDILEKRFIARRWTYLLSGFSIIALASILIKIQAPSNDLFGQRSIFEIFSQLTDLSRYQLIFNHLSNELIQFNNGRFSMFILLMGLLIFLGLRQDLDKKNLFLMFGAVLLTLIQYLLIYVITPKDLEWHLSSSLTRLIVQLYPSLIFIVFNIVEDPFRENGLIVN